MLKGTDYKKLLLDVIEKNILRLPSKPAYRIKGVSTTYKELGEMTERIASGLASRIKMPDGSRPLRIGIELPRNSHYIPCILAALKIGASYVPIDTKIPQERKRVIMSDSEMDYLITEETLPSLLESDFSDKLPYYYNSDIQEAYLIYTSGTTGVPKGVSQTPLTIYNYMQRATQPDDMNVSENSVVLHFAAITFDVSVMEIFVSLFAGATLVIAQEEDKHDSIRLHDLILSENITYAYLPPSLIALFPDFSFPSLDTLSAGGEAIPHSLTQRIAGQCNFRFVNGYGPTESFYATTHVITHADDWRCIGRPVPGVVGYVVDERLNEVDFGQKGELLLGGNQLANGYWNRPELNSKLFIKNPFEETAADCPVLYHTGDFVIRNEDGSFDYLGRIDSQVKLRGFRVELNEVCVLIEKHPRVNRAFVQIEEIKGEKYLVAYVVTSDGNSDLSDIKEYLKSHLPVYSLPTFWNHLDSFPLNINGKIDKTKLVNKAREHSSKYDGPLTDEEQILVTEVKEILGLEEVDIDADLISELGMTSLQAMRIPSDILVSGFYVTVDEIYRFRTIRKIAGNKTHELSYWYKQPDENSDKPVLIVISGYTSFSFFYKAWAEPIKDLYDIYVVESYHTLLKDVENPSYEKLTEINDELTREVAATRDVVAYVGFCLGGEQAMYLAHKRYAGVEKKPYAIVFDGETRRDTNPDRFIPLNWPFFTDEQNYKRLQIDRSMLSTRPDFIYGGPVVSILCDTFQEQQTITAEQQEVLPKELMDWYHVFFDRAASWWKEDYPDCTLFWVHTTHFLTLIEPEAVEVIVDYFKKLYHVFRPNK